MNLENLEPKLLWKHFIALSAIPRGSKNEKAAAAYVVAQARAMGLPVREDATGNVIVTMPASKGREKAPVTVLQGHLDMVCEKNEGTKHDFMKDGIRLVPKDEFLHADGTTLGADNGIGCAAALAVMESKDLVHGPLEFLFTIDEETGMTGAFGLTPDALTGRRMLNLDTEEEGAVYIGCAGGMDSVATATVRRTSPAAGSKAWRLKVSGLKGGHSGIEIHSGRGNALKALARALLAAMKAHGVEVASLDGGSKRNAIPREAFAIIYMAPAKEQALRADLAKLQHALAAEFGSADPTPELLLDAAADATVKPMVADDARRVLEFLHACPHGVLAMTPDIAGLVQTSTNLAIIETRGDELVVSMSHRSSIESAKYDVAAMVASYCHLAGFKVEQGTGYPGWAPNLSSPLLAGAKKVHAELFGKEPEIKAVHAGLECGLIGEKFPGMDMISFGPTILGAHSPTERVHVPSVESFWKYLKKLLEVV